jgi:hypothetical protein
MDNNQKSFKNLNTNRENYYFNRNRKYQSNQKNEPEEQNFSIENQFSSLSNVLPSTCSGFQNYSSNNKSYLIDKKN